VHPRVRQGAMRGHRSLARQYPRTPVAFPKNLGKSLCQCIDCDNRNCVRMEYPAESLARWAFPACGWPEMFDNVVV
jgi:hypothetical protein